MRRYMVSLDENYALLNDTDLIWEVEKLALPLALLTVKHQELEAALADLQAKLSTDWIIHEGKMYYFGDQTLQQEEWVKRCAALKAEIVSIEDKDKQRFLGTSVASRSGHFWIGYKYRAQDSKFVWHNPGVPAYVITGLMDFHSIRKTTSVSLLDSKCPMPYKCWMNHPCDEHQKGICKKSPEMRWLS
ncbi:killer cell lectin-like receptor subfamily F member 2 [Notechis scutatus]|uniref:Killer cell lectin-like receptor subfamily F member 2 n=1 Tax=Notechis scutatus TaxID=8663 RepID=A0A6J1VTJ7_9SAUR|nr:killer cell lectin-like receptor subfamily F member 2 [Notechis scutatus]